MTIDVEFFASLRETLGRASVCIADADAEQLGSVEDVRDWLLARLPDARSSELSAKRTRFAVNDEFVDGNHPVRAGDRVAFMPAVTGG